MEPTADTALSTPSPNQPAFGSEVLQLTQKAIEKVKYFASQDPEAGKKGFRVYVQGGGCSGFQYGFNFDERRDGDTVVTASDIEVLVDPTSLPYLKGSTVDFMDDFRGSGFNVTNPNAKASCGCGTSFTV
ncbi:MAG: iron-sulfur cluster insertion protein ErpA [Deltaproteobacteria bacterium]|nr:iron-sulfur cluster insertion protein ErpA [Deltaproteobacteria bacterium]